MTDNSIYTENLEVAFSNQIALDQVSVSIKPQCVTALTGGNGSGKTTLLRTLAGLNQIYTGKVSLFGETDLWAAKKFICYLPMSPYYRSKSTIKQHKKLLAEAFPTYQADVAQFLLTQYGFSEEEKLAQLSSGRQALALLILYLGVDTRLYLLDEPFANLDASTRESMVQTILTYLDEQKTFLISTHDMADVEALFDEIIILKDGKTALTGQADALREDRQMSLADLVKEYQND